MPAGRPGVWGKRQLQSFGSRALYLLYREETPGRIRSTSDFSSGACHLLLLGLHRPSSALPGVQMLRPHASELYSHPTPGYTAAPEHVARAPLTAHSLRHPSMPAGTGALGRWCMEQLFQ